MILQGIVTLLGRHRVRFAGIAAAACMAYCPAAFAETLTWADCVRLAQGNNPALVSAKQKVVAAEESAASALSARYPQLSASADSGRSSSSGESEGGGEISLGASVRLSQTLYSGGKNDAGILASDAGLLSARYSVASTEADVTYALRSAFAELLYAQESLVLVTKINERRKGNLELVQLRYQGGREHEGSVALSKASSFESQTDVTQATRRVASACEKLARTIGITNAAGSISVSGELLLGPLPSVVSVEALAEQTPGVRKAAASETSAQSSLDSARAGFVPSLNLSGSAGRSGDEIAFDDDSWSVGLGLSVPIWNGGATIHDHRKARAALQGARADTQTTRNSAVAEIVRALASLQDAAENVTVRESYLEASTIRASIARSQYENGLLAFENWDIIENDLISNQKRVLDARLSAVIAEAAWWKTCGKGLAQ